MSKERCAFDICRSPNVVAYFLKGTGAKPRPICKRCMDLLGLTPMVEKRKAQRYYGPVMPKRHLP
jgi:hypothetical protein